MYNQCSYTDIEVCHVGKWRQTLTAELQNRRGRLVDPLSSTTCSIGLHASRKLTKGPAVEHSMNPITPLQYAQHMVRPSSQTSIKHNKREQQSYIIIIVSEICDVILTFVFDVIILLQEVCDTQFAQRQGLSKMSTNTWDRQEHWSRHN